MPWWFVVVGLVWLGGASLARGATTFTASLDRNSAVVGEGVTLSLSFEGDSPATAPTVPVVPGLNIQYAGPMQQVTIINGQSTSSVTYNYTVTPAQSGVFIIPSIAVQVAGRVLRSQPLRLTVLKDASQQVAGGDVSQLAFLKLIVPKKEVYIGEAMPVEMRVYFKDAKNLQPVNLQAEGFIVGSNAPPVQTRAQVGNQLYSLVIFKTSIAAAKVGNLNLGPATCNLTLYVPSPTQRRLNPFMDPFDNPFGFFGRGTVQLRPLTLSSGPETLRVLPLPDQNVPPDFNGAVGHYSMAVEANPTNLTVGDPITVKVRLTGRGSLSTLTLPLPDNWQGFKTYPPSSKLENADPLGLEGVRLFEYVATPQDITVKALPPVSFSFFDPDQKSYQTLRYPPIALTVRPSASNPLSAGLASGSGQGAGRESPPAPSDILNIKTHLGVLSEIQAPLVNRPWFLILQLVPLLAWLTAVTQRRLKDNLQRNPRLRRQRNVTRLVQNGLRELRSQAEANQAVEFYATAFRLLQEQLGERLDLPAHAITEAVLEDHLRPRGVPEETLTQLSDLFHLCNQARYAPPQASEGLFLQLPRVESALGALRELNLT